LSVCAEHGSLAGLERFLRLLKETEHFRRWPQKEVAKIVQCGEPRLVEAAGSKFQRLSLFTKMSS
jgi:hypothetical protein